MTVGVWQAILQRLEAQAQHVGINKEFPEFGAGIVKRAIQAGYGDEDVAALIKVLRSAWYQGVSSCYPLLRMTAMGR